MIYAIYNDEGCITDGYDRDKVIESATDWLQQQAYDNGNYGSGDEEVTLVMPDESEEHITLRWYAEPPSGRMSDYRFDYLSAIGAL